MGGLRGMDVAEVEAIGRQLRAEASNIAALVTRVAAKVQVADQAWDGQDAQHFVSEWNTTRRGQLQGIQTQLAQLGQRALDEAAEQRRVSKGRR